MKTFKAQKLYNGYVSIRDYLVHTCIANQEDLAVFFDGRRMILKPSDLMLKRKQFNKAKIFSQFHGTYTLYDYKWEPDNPSQTQKDFFLKARYV